MPDAKQTKDAGYHDVAHWGEKDVSGAYEPGTVLDVAGEKVDLSKVPDIIGGKAQGAGKARNPK